MDLVGKVGIHFQKPEAPTLKYLMRPELSKLPPTLPPKKKNPCLRKKFAS